MDRPSRTGPSVMEEDRHTVRSLNTDNHTFPVSDHGIPCPWFKGVQQEYLVGMLLDRKVDIPSVDGGDL